LRFAVQIIKTGTTTSYRLARARQRRGRAAAGV
jgi:hypothetical protein